MLEVGPTVVSLMLKVWEEVVKTVGKSLQSVKVRVSIESTGVCMDIDNVMSVHVGSREKL